MTRRELFGIFAAAIGARKLAAIAPAPVLDAELLRQAYIEPAVRAVVDRFEIEQLRIRFMTRWEPEMDRFNTRMDVLMFAPEILAPAPALQKFAIAPAAPEKENNADARNPNEPA